MSTTRAFLNELKNFKRQGDVLYDPNVWRYSDTSGWERADFLTPGKWYASANPVDQYGPAPGTYLLSQAEKQEREESEREAQMERARQLINERFGVRGPQGPQYEGWAQAGNYLYDPTQWRFDGENWTRANGEYGSPFWSDDGGSGMLPGVVRLIDIDQGVSAPRSIEEALQRYDRSNFDVGATANYIRQINSQLGIPEEQIIAAIPVAGEAHKQSVGHGYTEGSNYQGIAAEAITNALRDMGYADRADYVAQKLQPIVDQGGADAYNRWQQTQEDNSLWARMVDFGGDIGRDLGIRPLLNTAADIAGAVGATGLERQSERLLGNLEEATEAGQRYYTEHPEAAILTAAAFAAPAVLGGAAAGSDLATAGLAAEASGAPATTAFTAGELAGAGAGAGAAGEAATITSAIDAGAATTITPTAASGAGGVADLVPYAELQGTSAVAKTAAAKAAEFLGASDSVIATLNNPMYAGMAQGAAVNAAKAAIAGGDANDILKAAAIGGATGGAGGYAASEVAAAMPAGVEALPPAVEKALVSGAGSLASGVTGAALTGGDVGTAVTNAGIGALTNLGTAAADVPSGVSAIANPAIVAAIKGGDPVAAATNALVNYGTNAALSGVTGLGRDIVRGVDTSADPTKFLDTSTTITPASTGEDTDSGFQISQAGDTSVGDGSDFPDFGPDPDIYDVGGTDIGARGVDTGGVNTSSGDTSVGDDYSDDYLTSLNEDFGGVIDTGGGYDIPAQDLIDIALATGDKSIIDAVNSALLESEAGGVDAGGGDTGGGDTGGGPSSGVDSAYGGDTEEGARDVPPASDWKTGAGDELPSGVYNPVTGEWKSTPPGYEPGSYIEQPDGTIVPSGTAFPGLSFKVGKDQNPSDVYKSLVKPGLSDYLKKFTDYVNPAAAIKKLYGAATGTEDPLDALLRAGASGAGIYGLLSLLGNYAKPSSGPTLQPYSGIDMRQYTPTGVGQPNTNVYQPTYTDYQKTPAAISTGPSEDMNYDDLIKHFTPPPAASTPPTPPSVSAPVTPTTPPTAEPGVSDKSLADTVLEMSVGKIPPDLTWDANGDGRITATDALRVQRGWKPPSYNPSSPAPTTPTTPSTPKPDDGFIPPPEGSVNTAAIETWRNKKTGETTNVPSGGYTPPSSDWERYSPQLDYGFIPPPEDVATTQAFENWKNKKTGETFTTRHGGYTPPSADWEQYDPNPIVSSASNPYGFTGGDGLQMDRVQWRNNKTGQTWSGNSSWNPPNSDWTRSGGEVPQIPESLLTVAPKRIPEDTTSSDAFPLTPPQSSTPFAKAVGLLPPETVPPSTPINPAQPQPTGWEGNLGPDDRPLGTVTAAVGGIMSLKDRAGSLQVGDEPWQTGEAWQEEPVRFMAMGGISSLGDYSDGGRLLRGPGDGMSDNIPATIEGRQPARLADSEFVIPADVVSHLGNGSTDAGAKQLYAMMRRIRKARTGNPKQGKQINPRKYLPA